MPGSCDIPRGNIQLLMLLGVPLSPASVAANTTAEQTFTVQGLLAGDVVNVTKPSTQAGLALGNARVSAVNTLAIEFVNDTASPITPTASESYTVELLRPSNSTLPAQVQ